MVRYRSGTPHRFKLTRMAYTLLDRGETDTGNEILQISREITSMTLNGSVPPPSVLRAIDLFLTDQRIAYCLIGGMAVNVHARPRETSDVDVLVEKIPDTKALRDRAYMGRFGFYPARSYSGGHLILDRDDGSVECLPVGSDLMRIAALSSARKHDVAKMQIRVVSPAFLIGLKIRAIASNQKRWSKDSQDILAVHLSKRPDLKRVVPMLDEKERRLLLKIIPSFG